VGRLERTAHKPAGQKGKKMNLIYKILKQAFLELYLWAEDGEALHLPRPSLKLIKGGKR
jgi:hypothetical protein